MGDTRPHLVEPAVDFSKRSTCGSTSTANAVNYYTMTTVTTVTAKAAPEENQCEKYNNQRKNPSPTPTMTVMVFSAHKHRGNPADVSEHDKTPC
jgi:hypothetical protein